jgi:plastocyanin
MHYRTGLLAVAAALVTISCGGGGGGAGTPTTPTSTGNPAPGGGGTVTINIIGDRGGTSFSPNPATVPTGSQVVWRNTDSIVHRVVIANVVDTGDINPGASSAPQALGAVSRGYGCLIHRGMVGALNGAAQPNPDPGGNCDIYGC